MKAHELRDKTLEDVQNELMAQEENLQTLKFQLVTHQLENTSRLKQVKKEVARLKTVIREHDLGLRPLQGPQTSE